MTYAKLFGSILGSTIWREPHCVVRVWITMLAMKDQDGIVEASVPGLADFARVTREEVDQALRVLLAPDPDSRTRDHEGRRIEVVDGGWRVVNHFKYRDKEDAEERRERARKRKADQRARAASRDVPLGHSLSRDVTARPALSRDVHPSDTETDHPDSTRGVSVSGGASFGGSGSVPPRRPEPPDPVAGPPSDRVQGSSPSPVPAVTTQQRPSGEGAEGPSDARGTSPAGARAAAPPPLDRGAARARGYPVRTPLPDAPISADTARAAPDPALALRQSLVAGFSARCNAARARLAVALGVRDVRPIALMGEGEKALMARLRESTDPSADLEHVLRVAEAEARARGELRWLGWTLAEPKSWRTKLAATLTEARRAPGAAADAARGRRPDPPAGSGSQPASPAPVDVELTPEEREEFSALAQRLAENPRAGLPPELEPTPEGSGG